jgi:hypothetical protein
MPTANEYCAMADECLKSARESSENERSFYLTLAKTWLEDAARNEVVVQQLHLSPAPRLR